MKKYIFLAAVLVLSMPLLAQNNIRMVTYFPVPYASYSDLAVEGSCDVGLLKECALDAGLGLRVFKKEGLPASKLLNTGQLVVLAGKLDLNSTDPNSYISSEILQVGRVGESEGGVLHFTHNLEVQNLADGNMQSAQALNHASLKELYLFGHLFPVCDAPNHAISWKKLSLNGTEGVFLVCGAAE